MKNLITPVIALLLSFSFAAAQEPATAPRTEFTLNLSASSVTAKTGESASVDVTFHRSKSFRKSEVTLGLSSSLPAGVSIMFDPASGLIDKTTAKITAGPDAKPGQYLIILKASMQNRAKGATLKLVISDSTVETATSKN